MPLNNCLSAVAVFAVATLFLLPTQYYVPEFQTKLTEPKLEVKFPEVSTLNRVTQSWPAIDFDIPALDLYLTLFLMVIVLFTYLCDWIQRKLMERRIIKLNEYLKDSLDKLRVWDTRQEQLEATLAMVQNATTEYNLLLYLLLRQHKLDPVWKPAQLDKELDDFINHVDTDHL